MGALVGLLAAAIGSPLRPGAVIGVARYQNKWFTMLPSWALQQGMQCLDHVLLTFPQEAGRFQITLGITSLSVSRMKG